MSKPLLEAERSIEKPRMNVRHIVIHAVADVGSRIGVCSPRTGVHSSTQPCPTTRREATMEVHRAMSG